MKLKPVFRENWLTKDPAQAATSTAFGLVALLAIGYFGASPASGDLVFRDGEYWRAWTTLFAHADIGHLLSNLFLFIPFAYLLAGYFSPFFFPLTGFFVGGLVNLVVLKTLPSSVILLGASGVVYWMGAAWITLSLLIDRRQSLAKRILKSIGVSALLFLPQIYRPEVSYLSHFLGYIAGVISATIYYAVDRRFFIAAEKYDYVWDVDSLWDPEINGFSEKLLLESFEETSNEEF
jgi:rhomboid protease GluP